MKIVTVKDFKNYVFPPFHFRNNIMIHYEKARNKKDNNNIYVNIWGQLIVKVKQNLINQIMKKRNTDLFSIIFFNVYDCNSFASRGFSHALFAMSIFEL